MSLDCQPHICFTAGAAESARHHLLSTSEEVLLVPLGNAAVFTAAGHWDGGAHSALDNRLAHLHLQPGVLSLLCLIHGFGVDEREDRKLGSDEEAFKF